MAATYRIKNSQSIGPISNAEKLRGQVVIANQTDASLDLSASKGIFYLENIVASSGTLSIKDGDGATVITGLSSLDFQISPLALKYGCVITGAILYMKGFIKNGVLS
jgi:ABC-type cobalamin transport system permease subunit